MVAPWLRVGKEEGIAIFQMNDLAMPYASGVNRRRFPIFPGADVHAAAAGTS